MSFSCALSLRRADRKLASSGLPAVASLGPLTSASDGPAARSDWGPPGSSRVRTKSATLRFEMPAPRITSTLRLPASAPSRTHSPKTLSSRTARPSTD